MLRRNSPQGPPACAAPHAHAPTRGTRALIHTWIHAGYASVGGPASVAGHGAGRRGHVPLTLAILRTPRPKALVSPPSLAPSQHTPWRATRVCLLHTVAHAHVVVRTANARHAEDGGLAPHHSPTRCASASPRRRPSSTYPMPVWRAGGGRPTALAASTAAPRQAATRKGRSGAAPPRLEACRPSHVHQPRGMETVARASA